MMRQMRENTKWIMLITAAAFVALMVFEWGMDASGSSAGAGNLGRVGSVNVGVQDYQNVYRNLYDQIQREQEQPISSQQNREIEDMAWDQVVNQILIQLELDRRGIRVSDEEIRQAARSSPPPELRNDPNFQTDGQFDMERYQAFLAQAAQDPQFLMQLEQYYRDVIPRSKLMRQVTSGIYVSDAELWRQWRDRNEQVEVSFLALNPARIPDSEVEVERDEIEDYYEDNQDEFAVPARARIRYTYLVKAPTEADTAAVRERAQEVRAQLAEGADFVDVADMESGDRETAPDGGRLGTITRGSGQLDPALEEAAFTLPVGEPSDPIRTGEGWHIVEVLSREGDEAELRHILIPLERMDDSEIRLLTRADSLESLGRDMPVQEAARQMGLPVREGQITEDYAILSGVGSAAEARTWIFEEQEEGLGAVSPVFENEETFYMLEIAGLSPAGTLDLEVVADEIENRLRLRKKLERVEEQAREMIARLRDGLTLEELAEAEGLEIQSAGPFARTDFVPGLGARNAAVGAAFGAEVGEVTGPVRALERILILRVEDRQEASREAWEAQKDQQRAQAIAEIRQQRLERWLDGLREVTRIRDDRAEYFRAAEEQDDTPQIPMAF